MNKTVYAFIRAMFLIWITTACVMGLVFSKDVIYAITLLIYLTCFINAEVRVADLEKRLKKYRKAYEKLSKMYNEDNNEEE